MADILADQLETNKVIEEIGTKPPAILGEIQDSELPQRSLLCKHYHSNKENHFESCCQTLEVKVFNRTKNIIAAATGAPLYDRKKFSFATQTTSLDIYQYQFRQKFQQTSRDCSCQPKNPILFNSDKVKGEYVINANSQRYETSEVFLERKLNAIIQIQAKIRQYNAIKYVLFLKQQFEEKKLKALSEQQKLNEEREKEKQYQLKRRIQPKTDADFQLLSDEINTWVRQQKFAIDQANLPAEARQAALELLVEKQARLIANIDQLKRVAILLNKADRVSIFFKKTSEPRKWQIYDGSYMYVNTPYTVRAATLRNVYFALDEQKSLDERLDLLLQTKFLLKEFDCELTRDTIRLIDQEADLLSRDRPISSLAGLRKRIQTNFLQFCECPEFNPAVAIVLNKDRLIFRPNTLPIIEKMNAVKREAIGRLKNNELKKGIYGQMDIFRRQFGMLGLSGMIRGGTAQLQQAGVLSNSQMTLMPKDQEQQMSLDEETQCFDDGYFCTIVDQHRFEEDGTNYQIEILAKDMDYLTYRVVNNTGAVWFQVGQLDEVQQQQDGPEVATAQDNHLEEDMEVQQTEHVEQEDVQPAQIQEEPVEQHEVAEAVQSENIKEPEVEQQQVNEIQETEAVQNETEPAVHLQTEQPEAVAEEPVIQQQAEADKQEAGEVSGEQQDVPEEPKE